ncbi:hypothetical protein Ancab_030857 [Ancistrocladus abbreviatus]
MSSHGSKKGNTEDDEAILDKMHKDIEASQDNALSLCTEKVLLARQAVDIKGKFPNSAKHDDIGKIGEYREQPRSPSLNYTSREEDRLWLKDSWYREVFSIKDLLGLERKIKESRVMDCSLRYLGGKASSSYVEDSLSGQNSMGNRSPVTKAVENHPIVVHSGEEGAVADLSITLQNGSRATDEGAGKGFS